MQHATKEQWIGFIEFVHQRGREIGARLLARGAVAFTNDGITWCAPVEWLVKPAITLTQNQTEGVKALQEEMES